MEKLDTLTPLGRQILNEIKEREKIDLIQNEVELEEVPESEDGN